MMGRGGGWFDRKSIETIRLLACAKHQWRKGELVAMSANDR